MGNFHETWMTAFLVSLAGLSFFQEKSFLALTISILFLLLIQDQLENSHLLWTLLGVSLALLVQGVCGMDLEAEDLWGREEVVRFKVLDLDDWGDQAQFTIAIPGTDLGRPFHKPYYFLLSSRQLQPSDLGGTFQGRLSFEPFPKTQLAGSFSLGDWQEGEGVSGQVTGRQFRKIKLGYFHDLRYKLKHGLGQGLDRLPDPAGPFIKRVFLGSSIPLDPDLKSQIQELGLAHLLAASGLHVHLLFQWGLHLLSIFCKKRVQADRVLFFFLFLYGWLLNFPPPIYRALVFLLFQDLALLFKLKVDKKRRWLFALTSYLFFRPYALKSKGLQLSFLCALAIDLAQRREKSRPLMSQLFQGVRVSFWISLLTLPIMAQVQASFPPIVFLANLLAIPFFAFLFRIGLVTTFLLPLPFLGPGLAKLLTWTFQAFLFLLKGLAYLSPKGVSLAPFSWTASQLAYYGLLFLIGLAYQDWELFRKQDLINRSLIRRLHYQAKFAWVLAFFFVIFQPLVLTTRPPRLVMVDVGQGDCFLVQSGGHAVLLDTGGVRDWQTGENKQGRGLASYLKNMGLSQLDGVFLSHSDYDHMGNLQALAQAIPIQKIYAPPWGEGAHLGQIFGPLSGKVHPVGERETYLSPDQAFAIKILIPGRLDGEDPNNEGMVTLLKLSHPYQAGHPLTVLFTGDREEGEEDLIQVLQPVGGADLLKVPHHGSNQGSSMDFLEAMTPKGALISVGLSNPYGHPGGELLKRLNSLKIPIHRTDLEGTVVVEPHLPLFEQANKQKQKDEAETRLPDWEIERLGDLKKNRVLAWMVLGLAWAYTIKKGPLAGKAGSPEIQ